MTRQSRSEFDERVADRDFSDFVEDLFGLNIKAVRTMRALIVNPALYFESARSIDWKGRYTPSIRLWLSLIALLSLLQFIWVGDDTPMVRAFSDGLVAQNVIIASGENLSEIALQMAGWTFAIGPVIQFLFMLAFAAFFRMWSEPAPLVMRVRWMFAVNTPAAALVPIFMVSTVSLTPSEIVPFAIAFGAVSFSVDIVTAARGAFPSYSWLRRLWRSAILALGLLTIGAMSSLMGQAIAIVLVGMRHGITLAS